MKGQNRLHCRLVPRSALIERSDQVGLRLDVDQRQRACAASAGGSGLDSWRTAKPVSWSATKRRPLRDEATHGIL